MILLTYLQLLKNFAENSLKLNSEENQIFDGDNANEVSKVVKTEPVVLVIDDSENSSSLSLMAEAESNELLVLSLMNFIFYVSILSRISLKDFHSSLFFVLCLIDFYVGG